MQVPELVFEVQEEPEGGYSANCVMEGEGLFTQGETLEELRANLIELAELYLDGLADDLGADAPSQARITMRFVTPVAMAA